MCKFRDSRELIDCCTGADKSYFQTPRASAFSDRASEREVISLCHALKVKVVFRMN